MRTPRSGFRFVTRIEQPKKGSYGWWVRLNWKGGRYARWFADRENGGVMSGLLAAVAWRNEKCKELGKPITWRTVVTRSPRNRTGVIGVRIMNSGQKKGCLDVSWAVVPGKVNRTSVSVRKHGERKALAIARRIRRQKEVRIYGYAYQ